MQTAGVQIAKTDSWRIAELERNLAQLANTAYRSRTFSDFFSSCAEANFTARPSNDTTLDKSTKTRPQQISGGSFDHHRPVGKYEAWLGEYTVHAEGQDRGHVSGGPGPCAAVQCKASGMEQGGAPVRSGWLERSRVGAPLDVGFLPSTLAVNSSQQLSMLQPGRNRPVGQLNWLPPRGSGEPAEAVLQACAAAGCCVQPGPPSRPAAALYRLPPSFKAWRSSTKGLPPEGGQGRGRTVARFGQAAATMAAPSLIRPSRYATGTTLSRGTTAPAPAAQPSPAASGSASSA